MKVKETRGRLSPVFLHQHLPSPAAPLPIPMYLGPSSLHPHWKTKSLDPVSTLLLPLSPSNLSEPQAFISVPQRPLLTLLLPLFGSQEALGLKTQEGSGVAWRRAHLSGALGDRSRRLDWDQLWTLFLASSWGGVEAKSHRMCLWPGRELESSDPLLGRGDADKEAVCRTIRARLGGQKSPV